MDLLDQAETEVSRIVDAENNIFREVRAKLRRRHERLEERGWSFSDFIDNGRRKEEIFFGNLTPAEFDALPLKSKRNGGPARVLNVYGKLYSEAYKDKESIGVYVQTKELDALGIKYKWPSPTK
jgi:hypothetical protein